MLSTLIKRRAGWPSADVCRLGAKRTRLNSSACAVVEALLLLGALGSCATATPGLVEVQPPNEKTLQCANHSPGGPGGPEWRVVRANGTVRFEPLAGSPPRHRDPMPFDYQAPGDRYVLGVEDGFLVGWNEGEFGGGLDLVDPRGQRIAHVSDENVHGMF